MPEPITQADHALIAQAAEAGYTVTRRQLRRWRADDLLPHRLVKGTKRAGGIEGLNPPGSAEQLVALCEWRSRYPRSADKIAISLWYDGWPVQTERARSAVLRGFERERRRKRVSWDQEPFSDLEKMSGRNLATEDLDPAETLSPTQLIRDAREDLSSVLFGATDSVSEPLISGYFQLDALNETLPDDGRPGFDVETAMAAFNLDNLISDLRGCSVEELEAVRGFLRGTYEAVQLLRSAESGIDTAELPTILAQGLALLDFSSDTRHPEFEAGKLLAAVGSGLALLRNFEPSRLENPQ